MPNQVPYPSFKFQVEWGGAELQFSEVSGLSVEAAVLQYRETSSKENSSLKRPGLVNYSNLILKRGIIRGNNEFFTWMRQTILDKTERRDLNIKLLNEDHEPIMVWKVKNAFPVRYEGPHFNTEQNELASELLEIAHEGFVVETA